MPRDLSVFANERFRLAVFAFNGIDYVGHADRLRILAELRRVQAPAGWLVEVGRHSRRRRREQAHRDHAILNDEAPNFRLLTSYTDRRSQRAQLEAVGFVPAAEFGADGRRLGPDDEARDSAWRYYLARKMP